MKKKIIIITGQSGGGKGSVIKILRKELEYITNAPTIIFDGIGDQVRTLKALGIEQFPKGWPGSFGSHTQGYELATELIQVSTTGGKQDYPIVSLILSHVMELIDSSEDDITPDILVVDGSPRDRKEIEFWSHLMAEYDVHIVFVEASEEICRERLIVRTEQEQREELMTDGKVDIEKINKKLSWYDHDTLRTYAESKHIPYLIIQNETTFEDLVRVTIERVLPLIVSEPIRVEASETL